MNGAHPESTATDAGDPVDRPDPVDQPDPVAARLARARARRSARQRPSAGTEPGTVIGRRPAGSHPLSGVQRGFWFVHQLDPGHDPFHLPIAVRFRGPLDRSRLIDAWRAVVRRHEALRTRIEERDGEPVAVVDPEPGAAVTVLSGAGTAPDLAAMAAAAFDLATGQPWRLTLIDTGTDDTTMLLTVHHIACDGWSIGRLLTEIAAGYRGDRVPEPSLQAADVTHYRNTVADGDPEGGRRDLDYWIDQLADAPQHLELPTDRPRRPGIAPSAQLLTRPLGRDAAAALTELMQRTSSTGFMVLLAAWHVLAGRWAGTDDTVIGAAVAGRDLPEIEPLIGCFVDTVVLRLRTDTGDTVRDLLARASEVTLNGLSHRCTGYDQVVEAVRQRRQIAPNGLFDLSLTVHTEPPGTLELPGMTTEMLDVASRSTQVELAVHASGPLLTGSADGEALIAVKYSDQLYDPATVRRLLEHLDQVLVELAAGLDRPVADVRLLTDAELAALPALAGAGVEPRPLRAATVQQLIWPWADLTPDAIAVSSLGVDLTYRELRESALRLAGRLVAAGVGTGDRVGLFVERSCDVIVGMLGIMSAGAAYVPVDPMYPDARVAAVFDGADVSVLLTQRALAGRVAGRPTVLIDDPDLVGAPSRTLPGISSSDLAYVLFTSGTTGAPKGVAVEHGQLLGYLAGAVELHGVADGWSWAMMSTPAADLGLTAVFGALSTGGRLHLLGYEQVTDPAAVARYLARFPIDVMKLVPSHLQALWDDAAPAAVLPRRLIILAGEALPWDLVDRIRSAAPDLAVHNSYGPSETTVATMFADATSPAADTDRAGGTVPIGRPFPGTRAHVVDADGRAVPVGVPGELIIAGPTVARGYFGRDDLTAERFVAEPQLPGLVAERAYRTGDLVRRLPDGRIGFIGRVDDQVKIRGYRVEPREVARCLAGLDGIVDCAVVLRDDDGRRRLVAYLVPAAGRSNESARWRADLLDRLPDYMVPAEYVELERIPLGANGKVDRGALPTPTRAAVDTSGDGRLTGSTEQRVAAVWAQVLGVAEVGAVDDFFAIGGDSFSTVKVVRGLDGDVSVMDIFGSPTVRGLAELIDRRSDGGQDEPAALLHRLSRPTTVLDSECVHLICVPFGGGSPVAFVPLAEQLPADFVVHGVNLPGHDTSRPDEQNRPISAVATDLVEELADVPGPLVLFGHCLGGALAVETALQLEAAGRRVLGVVESGTFPAARIPGRFAEWLHRVLPGDRMMSDRAYLDWLRALGGFSDDMDERDQRLLMAALRHDNREAESYYTARYSTAEKDQQRLTAPMLCVVGARDRATQLYQERFGEWRDFSDDVDLAVIPDAGHFYTRHQPAELAAIVAGHARQWAAGERPASRPAAAEDGAASVRTFLVVALTQLLSMIGTGLTSFALGIWVLQQTGSVTAFATISAVAVLPAIVALPIAGAMADRYDRRKLMLAADSAAGVMTASLVVLLATGHLQLWFIYAFAGVGSLSTAFQRPAYLAAITQLVPKQFLGQANGLVSLGMNSGDVVAAVAGGTLLGLLGLPGVIAIDVVTFLAAVAVILGVRFPNRLFVRREEPFRDEILGGWRYVIARPEMIAMVAFFCLFNYLFTFPLVLATPLLLANHSTGVLGLVLGCGGLGGVAGAVLMALWGGTRRRAIGMVGGTAVLGAAVVVAGVTADPVVIAVGLFLMYGSLLVLNAHWLSLIQTKVGLELQGRVLAANQMIATAMMPLGFLTVGPITAWTEEQLTAPGRPLHWVGGLFGDANGRGYGSAMVLIGLALTVWGVAGLCYRRLKNMDLTLPDAVAQTVFSGNRDELQQAADAALGRPGAG